MSRRWQKTAVAGFVCTLLSLGMVLTASAAWTDEAEISHPDAVKTLIELEIIKSPEDGSPFDPAATVTRAEMANMLCCIWNSGEPRFPAGEPLPDAMVEVPPDSETHWALPYIQFCMLNDLIAGRGNNTFDPDGAVTGLECAKMLLVSIGYLPDHEGFVGIEWAEHVQARAEEAQLFSGLSSFDPASALSRDDAAQIIYNALTIPCIQYDYKLTTVDGTLVSTAVPVEATPPQNLLSRHFAMEMVDGKVVPLS